MNGVNYLIQVNLYLIIFYGFYYVFLKNETFFQLNRIYLFGSAILSLLIPVFYFDWVKDLFLVEEIRQSSGYVFVQSGLMALVVEDESWVLGDYLALIYIIGTTIFLSVFIYKLITVSGILKSENNLNAFSFFRKINIADSLPQKEVILTHEKAHAKQLHTLDVLFFELLKVFNWFNPVCYLYKKAIQHLHEFIADEQVIATGKDKQDYALLLFNESFGSHSHQLTNTFFNKSLLKRRIQMLHKQKSRKVAFLKYGLSVPLFLAAMVLSSATISESKAVEEIAEKIEPKKELQELLLPQAHTKQQQVTEQIFATKKTQHPSDTLTGKASPSSNTDKQVLVISGKQRSKANAVDILNNKNIGRIEIIKGAEAVSLYGEEARNGVIIIHDKDSKNAVKDSTTVGAKTLKNLQTDEIVVIGYSSKSSSGSEPVFANVDVLPQYPGGMTEFYRFLGKTINYPKNAREKNIEGRVTVNFVVEKDGSLTDFKILRGVEGGEELGEEALRVLKLSPNWKPGIQNGKEVRVSYSVPVVFKLQGTTNKTKPYILVDGKAISEEEMKKIDPKTIESIDVLKDKSATDIYREKGKNGVVIITLKK